LILVSGKPRAAADADAAGLSTLSASGGDARRLIADEYSPLIHALV